MEDLLKSLPPEALLGVLAVGAMMSAVLNTMAGGGSMLVLPLLLAVGLPPGVANGTLRVGILLQNVSALTTFYRQGERPYRLVARLAVPVTVGAAGGAVLATRLSDALLLPLIGVLLVGWAVVLLVRPGTFLQGHGGPREPTPVVYVAAVGVGFYGGFLQVGVGFPLLALLTLGFGLQVVQANAVKLGLVLLYTLVSLPVFAASGQVAWREGAALATGAVVGGWLGTRWQLRGGAGLVRWFIVAMAALSGGAMVVRSLGATPQ